MNGYVKMLYIMFFEVRMEVDIMLDGMGGKELTPLFIGRERCEGGSFTQSNAITNKRFLWELSMPLSFA